MLNSRLILPPGMKLGEVKINLWQGKVLVNASSLQRYSRCPLCKKKSKSIHSYYQRQLADLPVSNYQVKINLRSRRFICRNHICARKIFTERFCSELGTYSRRLQRSRDLLTKIGLELGGVKTAMISRWVGSSVSAATVIRMIKSLPAVDSIICSGIIGVDDWALKKGRTYGTILVDLHQNRVIDLWEGRSAEALEAWLKQHPEVHTVARDRASAYSLGIRKGAPQARQVADRFHLLVNLREALDRAMQRQSETIKKCFVAFHDKQNARNQSIPLNHETATGKRIQTENSELFTGNVSPRRQFKFEQTKKLYAQGHSINAIAAHLKSNRKSIRRYIHLDVLPARNTPTTSEYSTNFDHFIPYIQQNYGPQTTYKQLLADMIAQGFNGKYTSFCERMNRLVAQNLVGQPLDKPQPLARQQTWSSTKLAFIALTDTSLLPAKDLEFFTFLCQHSAPIQKAAELAQQFKTLLGKQHHGSFDEWLESASHPDSLLKNFAKGIKSDYHAVEQAINSDISSGKVEGHINKLKTIKRSMYGRAGIDLLTKMLLAKNR